MKWDQMDFVHLFLPVDESLTVWDERRAAFATDPGFSVRGWRTDALRALPMVGPALWSHANDLPVAVVTGAGFGREALSVHTLEGRPCDCRGTGQHREAVCACRSRRRFHHARHQISANRSAVVLQAQLPHTYAGRSRRAWMRGASSRSCS
jgi:hypothetical protein